MLIHWFIISYSGPGKGETDISYPSKSWLLRVSSSAMGWGQVAMEENQHWVRQYVKLPDLTTYSTGPTTQAEDTRDAEDVMGALHLLARNVVLHCI